jgi:hypothetical protein
VEAGAVLREHGAARAERRAWIAQVARRLELLEPVAPGLQSLLQFGWDFSIQDGSPFWYSNRKSVITVSFAHR